jgi:hypothetical protein
MTCQCHEKTPSGEQCKRKTKHSYWCGAHLKMHHVAIRPSTILFEDKSYKGKSVYKRAGMGLYAQKNRKAESEPVFDKGDKITPYGGEVITQAEADRREAAGKGGYMVHVNKKFVLDAPSNCDAPGRYANDGVFKQKKDKANARISLYTPSKKSGKRPRATLVADKPIKNKDEILLDYGEKYWSEDAPKQSEEPQRKKKKRKVSKK